MSTFVTVNNVVIDKTKVSCLIQDPQGEHKVTVYFDNGQEVAFVGAEAAEVWKAFDEGDYADD